jgi:hypothetical protein
MGMAKARREIYRLVTEEYEGISESARDVARRRLAESDVEIESVRAFHARRRWIPTPLRRRLGRAYRALRSRGSWYEAPPPEAAVAFPDLRQV